MIPHHISPTLLAAPAADLLEKLYSVTCVNTLYRDYFLPVSGAHVREKAKKSVMVAELMAMKGSPETLEAFCQQMPPALQKALQILAWVESRPLVELEKEVGAEIVHIETGPPRRAGDYRAMDEKVEMVELFDLIIIQNMRPYWSYGAVTKSNATALLPPALRNLFKRGLPAPAHSTIIALGEWSGLGRHTRFHDGGACLADDLGGLGDGFRRGNIKRNKDGSLSKSCLREFKKLVRGEEFFPHAAQGLESVRLQLLLEFFNRKGKPLLPPENLTSASLAGFLHEVVKEVGVCHAFVLDEILSHIRPDAPGANPHFLKEPFARLVGLFSSLPEGSWVSARNLVDFPMYREIDLQYFAVRQYSARRVRKAASSERSYGYSHDRVNLSRDHAQDLLLAPMIFGMAFLLAALGFLEICYDAPEGHSTWHRDDLGYLTPFDGLEAVRLTPAGAFAFGRRKDLALTVHEQPKCEVLLHPDRLLARATLLDPLTEKLLREFMEELEPGFYRLDRKKFLSGCFSPEQIRERVKDFKRRIPAGLPPFWEAYLEGLTCEGPALRPDGKYTIFALGDSPDLARLFASDPELRTACLRVEGRRVAIPDGIFPDVRKRLLKAGFIV